MRLTPCEITYLGGLFEKTTPLSPFVNNKQPLKGDEAKTLEEKGVLQGGALTEEALTLLRPLAAPRRGARMILQKPFCLLEKYTYPDGDGMILAESDGEGLVLTRLDGDSQPVLDALGDFLPHSSIKTAGFTVDLGPSQALALTACIDLCRSRALSAYLTGEGADMSFTAEEVAGQLETKFVNGLTYGLAGNVGLDLPDGASVPQLLAGLKEKKCLEDTPQGRLALSEEYRLFAGSFLLYDSLLMAQAYQMTGENSLTASMDLSFISGMHDVLCFSAGSGTFELTTLSGADLRGRLKDTLDCPKFDV
ncbi:MAG: hypothetical protein E7423_04005 [Ruminococcaceae bacterium]|nr:hypothetical protein [Oscillospiraceae bacterium]